MTTTLTSPNLESVCTDETPGQPADLSRNTDKTDRIAKYLTVLVIVSVVATAMLTLDLFTDLLARLRGSRWSYSMLLLGQVLLAINITALAWRIILVRRYKSVEACSDEELLSCTVIVPAYNEGKQVLWTIRSLANSDYPREKLQIIAINDGSKDDTWQWIHRAQQEFPDLVQAINCVENRGKRHALNEGFLLADGEIIVTVDSDSVVDPGTLRSLASPMSRDETVGGVAGNVRVLNRNNGIIPRMLDVSFTYSFDFIRASQSQVNTVMCMPGALAAYRTSIVKEVREEWLAQTFCGRPAHIGEDRSMTNHILRSGSHVKFQREAVVYTKVPTDYKTLCKMFLRWGRSNVRETLIMSNFAFRKFRPTPATGARVNLLLHIAQMTIPILLRIQAVLCLIVSPLVFGVHMMLGTALASMVSVAVYSQRHRSSNGLWAVPYSMFWIIGLSWIGPYAMLTAHKSVWLTRQISPGQLQTCQTTGS